MGCNETPNKSVLYETGNRVAQVYVTGFGDVKTHPLEHRGESNTLLFRYFVDAGVQDHIQSENSWVITNRNRCKKMLDEEGGIQVSQTEPHLPFQNNTKQEIQKPQRLFLYQNEVI